MSHPALAAQATVPATTTPSAPLRRHGVPLLTRAASAPRRIWFQLVNRQVDRHGTIIEPAGVDLTAFRANPVFLWMHQSGGEGLPVQPPPDVVIGRVVMIDQTDEHLDIEVEFDDDGADGLASTCYRKVRDGFIRMVSIGCNPLVEDTVRVGGVDVPRFTRTELLECSLVIIGSNRGAMKIDRAAVAAVLRGLDETEQRDVVQAAAPTTTPPKHVSTVAVVADDHMLWGRRRDDDKWTTPGGHAKPGEDALRCAARELAEEAGILVPLKRFQHLGDVVTDKDVNVHVYRVDLSEKREAVATKDPDKEIAEWRWVRLEDGKLPDEILHNLHAPRNAVVAALRLDRAVAGAAGPAIDFLLSSTVDGDLDRAVFAGDGTPSDDEDVDFDIYDDDDEGGDDIVVKSAPISRGVVPHKAFPVVQGAWDAAAAVDRWRKWASSDGSGDKDKIDWKKYAECFLWFDSKDPENFNSYKFPHHDIRDGKPVTIWAGVVAAAARIDQAKGIPAADITKMKQHLAAHYKEAGKVAPWQRVEKDFPGGLATAWQRAALPVSGPAKTYLPEPIVAATDAVKNGPAHTPVDEDGMPVLMKTTTVQALLFPKSKFTVADAVVWAKDHGYVATGPVQDDGDNWKIVQLPENIFLASGLGRGKKFAIVEYPSGVSCVVGVIKPEGMRFLRNMGDAAAVTAPLTKRARKQASRLIRALVDARLSPSAKAEIGYGLAKAQHEQDASVSRARRMLEHGTWCARQLVNVTTSTAPALLQGGYAGQRDARAILRQASAALDYVAIRDAAAGADVSELQAHLSHAHNPSAALAYLANIKTRAA